MLWNLLTLSRKVARRTDRRKSAPPCRLALELLEDRMVPTVLDTVNFTENTFVNSPSLNVATGMAWAPDGSGRLFVTRKGGEIRTVQYNPGGTGSAPALFTTVSPVFTNSECGLIGITFDRDFINNHYVYVFATVSSGEQQIIRYTDVGGVGMNKTVLISGLPTAGQNHDGGGIAIGPDNKLYWGIGDLGNGTGVDLDLTTLAAKIGRANLDGSPVSDNPFNDNDGTTEPTDYIWARGWRNPFTMTVQELPGQAIPGRLWVDVAGTSYEQIFQPNAADHAGYNDFENNQPVQPPNTNHYIAPKIKYRTNGTDTRSIAAANGAVRSGNIVTFSTTAPHLFRQGELITIAGVSDSSFNGTFYIQSANNAPTTTTFTVAQIGPNATSGGGTAQTQNLGGALTGSTFYDGTDFAAPWRGNYFFADYNSGRINRATLDANNNITSVDYFATNVTNAVDVTVGPDGALYYIGVTNNTIHRVTFNHGSSQDMILSQANHNLVEGGAGVFSVRLAVMPSSDITVNVARTAGDADVTINNGSTLTFTPSNWNVPQNVFLSAAQDNDTVNDTATLSVSSAGLVTQTVSVGSIDNDTQVLVLNTTSMTITEGSTGTFTVSLQNQPVGNATVNVARSAGDSDITVQSGATLTFTPGNYNVPQTVTIAAAEDADNADDSATISISSAGANLRTVAVTAIDNDNAAPVITSTPVTTAVVNAPYTYDVNATGGPAPSYSLITSPAGMTINTTTGVITWTPASTGLFDVTVRATNGVVPDDEQSWTITVNPDMPPTAILTAPSNGGTVSGTQAEFFGDAVDDVGSVRAEFYIDNVLRYTDVNNSGHYHFGGAHNLWDTTTLSNGSHTLRFVVYDTIGQSGFQQVTVTVDNASPPVIIDNGDTGFSEKGNWQFVTGSGYQSDYHTRVPGNGSKTASWTFPVTPGQYRISATWLQNSDRATNAPFTVLDGRTTRGTVLINQQLAPNDFSEGGTSWEDLGGPYTIAGNTIVVRLSAQANGRVIADAIRVQRISALASVLDDRDVGFSLVGNWRHKPGSGYQTDYYQRSAGNGSKMATWTFDVTPGQYRISATWLPRSNRATNAPFTVSDEGTTVGLVLINQQMAPKDYNEAGTLWEDLGGPYTIIGSTIVVRLSNQANGRVIADAIRVERIGT